MSKLDQLRALGQRRLDELEKQQESKRSSSIVEENAKLRSQIAKLQSEISALEKRLSEVTGKPATSSKRSQYHRAYMREYMRKRRSGAKSDGQV